MSGEWLTLAEAAAALGRRPAWGEGEVLALVYGNRLVGEHWDGAYRVSAHSVQEYRARLDRALGGGVR